MDTTRCRSWTCHALMVVAFTLIELGAHTLPRTHPTRVFLLGRVDQVRPTLLDSVR